MVQILAVTLCSPHYDFLEQSVKNAARAYVFEPNDANTWINMKCMIENFLRSVWKRGGLAGSTPEEAYEVHVGLGDTMTNDDILEGTMRITVFGSCYSSGRVYRNHFPTAGA